MALWPQLVLQLHRHDLDEVASFETAPILQAAGDDAFEVPGDRRIGADADFLQARGMELNLDAVQIPQIIDRIGERRLDELLRLLWY